MYVIKQSADDHYVFMGKYCQTYVEALFWVEEYDLREKGWDIYVY